MVRLDEAVADLECAAGPPYIIVARDRQAEEGERAVGAYACSTIEDALDLAREASEAGCDIYVVRNSVRGGQLYLKGSAGEREPVGLGELGNPPRLEDVEDVIDLPIDIDPAPGADVDAAQEHALGLLDALSAEVPIYRVIDTGRGVGAGVCPELGASRDEKLALAKRVENWLDERADKALVKIDRISNINRVTRLAGFPNTKTGRVASMISVDLDAIAVNITSLLAGVPIERAREQRARSGFPEERAALWPLEQRIEAAKRFIATLGPAIEGKPSGGTQMTGGTYTFWACQKVGRGFYLPPKISHRLLMEEWNSTNQPPWESDDLLRKCEEAVEAGDTVQWGAALVLLAWRERQSTKLAAESVVVTTSSGEEKTFEIDVKTGRPRANSPYNIKLAMEGLGVTLGYNAFADRSVISGLDRAGPALDDDAMIRLRLAICEAFDFLPIKDTFFDVVNDVAKASTFHPVLDYLDSLEWDGVPRIGTWLINYAGAADTPYTRAIGRLVLVAAVRRVRSPGCKFDEMLILESEQGLYKSSALRALAVNDDWFTDDLPLQADSRKQMEAIGGRWIVEASELKGMTKADDAALRSFLSRQTDKARLAYGRAVKVAQRQCVIIGTTNDAEYLKDRTGNRRFWPVKVQKFDFARLVAERDQLWAEAVVCEEVGESIRLDESLWDDAAAEQEKRKIIDPFFDVLSEALGDLVGKIPVRETWEILQINPSHRHQPQNERLGLAMRELGWERVKRRMDGKLIYCYVRGNEEEQNTWLIVKHGHMGRIKVEKAPPDLRVVT